MGINILKEHMESLENGVREMVEAKVKVVTGIYDELLKKADYASSITLEDLWKDIMTGAIEYSLEFLNEKIGDINSIINDLKDDVTGKYTEAVSIVFSMFQSETYQSLVKTSKMSQSSIDSVMFLLVRMIIRETIISMPSVSTNFKKLYIAAIEDVSLCNVNSSNFAVKHSELVGEARDFILSYLRFMDPGYAVRGESVEEKYGHLIEEDLKKYIFMMGMFINGRTKFKSIYEDYSRTINSYISQNALDAYRMSYADNLSASDKLALSMIPEWQEIFSRDEDVTFQSEYKKNREESVPKLVNKAHDFVDEIDRITKSGDFKSDFTRFMTEPIGWFFDAQDIMSSMVYTDRKGILNLPDILAEIGVIDDLKLIGIRYDMKELVENELIWRNRLIINEDDSDFIRIRENILKKLGQMPDISHSYSTELDNIMKMVVFGITQAISKYTAELTSWSREEMIEDSKNNVEKVIISMSTLEKNMGYGETAETMLLLNSISCPKLLLATSVAVGQLVSLTGIYTLLSTFINKADDIEKAVYLLADYLGIDFALNLPDMLDNAFYYLIGKYIDFTPLSQAAYENEGLKLYDYINELRVEIRKIEESVEIFKQLKKLL